jgi:hypothetical protein
LGVVEGEVVVVGVGYGRKCQRFPRRRGIPEITWELIPRDIFPVVGIGHCSIRGLSLVYDETGEDFTPRRDPVYTKYRQKERGEVRSE